LLLQSGKKEPVSTSGAPLNLYCAGIISKCMKNEFMQEG